MRASRRQGTRKKPDVRETARRASTVRAVILVAAGALLQAVVVPYATLGLVAPAPAMLSVAVATAGLREPVALPVGFLGGTLVDALGSGLFGAGALSGLLAAAVSVRAGIIREGTVSRVRLAGAVAVAVAAYDLVSVAALGLSGSAWPPVASFVVLGMLPDATLNALLAYAVGGVLLALVLARERSWT